MELVVTQTVTVPANIDPVEIGNDMAMCALSQWYEYDDEGTFLHTTTVNEFGETVWYVSDPDENKSVTFTAAEFFRYHAELIWLSTITNYRHDWIDFAFKSNGAEPDEYDANTCDAVLQNMLYGQVVYG